MSRVVLYVLLAVVALAAAVLSFSALTNLAILCGFGDQLAPLLPVAVDAGAGAGAVAWLGRGAEAGRVFGRALALTLLAASVAGNALGHALAAYQARPHWGVVVAVSAVAPAVLGAVTHLAVLVLRAAPAVPRSDASGHATEATPAAPVKLSDPEPARLHLAPIVGEPESDPVAKAVELLAAGAGRPTLARELGLKDHQARKLAEEPHRAEELLTRWAAP